LLPLRIRINYLETFGQILSANKENLTKAISQETGKPLWDAAGEVTAMLNKINISFEAYALRCPELTKKQSQGISITRHKPHGVLAVFGPYNFPGHLPNGHIIPALLAGNTIVFKPSEQTPYVAELLMGYWRESGLPKGVINLVQGGKTTGKLVAEHTEIDGLLFTGSWQTGKLLAEQFAKFPQKILALEMGGNNPLVISNISDVKIAAHLTILSAFLSSGQRCTCARRLIIFPTEQSDAFIDELIRMTQSIVVGAYDDIPEPFMGPIISSTTAEKLIEQQKELLELGGRSLIPMSRLTRSPAYLTPGIIDMTHAEERPDQELFGPLLQIIRVKNFKAALIEANRTAYGLTAGIFTDSAEEYQEFYRQIKAGVINWNVQLTGASSAAPFGGIGKSGNHRPSALYAADYCAHPVASLENPFLKSSNIILPGISV
ncbi:MAG: succinylglutamate-semialdehyde dehydrogenase, partial [Parachlamydiaceae bacterium]|nr:succinylglutamate-semialdehyde dehydrogenase [Parachlamydiaceae bacterium]